MNSDPVIKQLQRSIPQIGKVTWIGLRPDRNTPTKVVSEVEVQAGSGLVGDRFRGKIASKRQVTLIQEEHLGVVGSIVGKKVDPALLRRNILVKGINLVSLHNQTFKIGEVILKGTGYCYPCSKMEEALGEGGYNAMRGHGGITASVVQEGRITVGDQVALIDDI